MVKKLRDTPTQQIWMMLLEAGWEVTCINAAKGYWRSSPYAEAYRWNMIARPPSCSWDCCIGCWSTMTQFLKMAKKYGFSYDSDETEIYENES